MRIPHYRIDAFAAKPFQGNPAGVCPLGHWLADDTLQAIAAEVNLPATAFFVRGPDAYAIRWFTPRVEDELCGHATLAAAYVILNFLEPAREMVRFAARCASLGVTRDGDIYALDLPASRPEPVDPPAGLAAALGAAPAAVLAARSYIAVFDSEAEVAALAPDMDALERLDLPGVVATAPGGESDIVCRYFAPAKGIPEDPATGSAHAQIVPYWADRLGRRALYSRQISKRGGALWCEDRGDRVRVAGRAALYLKGEMVI